MTNNLFVGGLPYETTREELTELFSAYGKVNGVKLIMDGLTGRCKGFGFVEMSTEAEAQAAIAKLNGTTLGQRQLFIGAARSQEKRPAREKRPADKPRPDRAKRKGFGGKKKWRKGPGVSGGKKKWGGKRARAGRRDGRRSS
jgi:RNA recognition motif-containing protein